MLLFIDSEVFAGCERWWIPRLVRFDLSVKPKGDAVNCAGRELKVLYCFIHCFLSSAWTSAVTISGKSNAEDRLGWIAIKLHRFSYPIHAPNWQIPRIEFITIFSE